MKLFERVNIGTMQLRNRVVLAPMGTTTDHTYGFNERDVSRGKLRPRRALF